MSEKKITKNKINRVTLLVIILGVILPTCAEGKMNKNTESAVEVIKSCLADKDPIIRSNAIEAVATTKYMDLMPKVQELMTDNYVMVRFAAIVAVGDVKYVPAAKIAKKLLEVKDENTKLAAAYAMVKLGSPEYLDNIRQVISSKDDTLKSNAAFLLGKIGDKGSLDLLYGVIKDQDASNKAQLAATVAIAKLGDEKIFSRLWATALSKYSDDRIVGIEGIGSLGTNQARDVLITKLDDEDVWVRIAAAGQLGKMGNKTGQTEVLEVLSGAFYADMDKQSLERLNIMTCLAIGQICSPEVSRYLPGFLANESKSVRIAAARAILQCRGAKK